MNTSSNQQKRDSPYPPDSHTKTFSLSGFARVHVFGLPVAQVQTRGAILEDSGRGKLLLCERREEREQGNRERREEVWNREENGKGKWEGVGWGRGGREGEGESGRERVGGKGMRGREELSTCSAPYSAQQSITRDHFEMLRIHYT